MRQTRRNGVTLQIFFERLRPAARFEQFVEIDHDMPLSETAADAPPRARSHLPIESLRFDHCSITPYDGGDRT